MIYEFWEKISAKIKEIQSKPEKEKVKIVWISAILIVAVIAIIWVAFLGKYEVPAKSAQNNRALEDLKNNLEKQFKDKFGGKLQIPKVPARQSPFPSI